MKPAILKNEIYQKLKKAIDDGIYPPGSFLPGEIALAQILGISRVTLRSVLTQLSDEKIIERLYPKGTMVCDRRSKIQQPISFLLPCTDFLSDSSSDVAVEVTRRMLKGVSEVAFEYNRMVQLVPVSPTNNHHDINWSKLDFVNKDSQLIINSYWYSDLFPLLSKSGCRVAFVEYQTYHFDIHADYLKEWFLLRLDRYNATETAVKSLVKKGYRRIALVHKDITEKNHPVMQGYKDGMAKCGLQYAARLDFDTQNTSVAIIAATIAGFYEKNNFDALLLDPILAFRIRRMHLFNNSIGLPENIKIVTVGSVSYIQTASQSISSMEFPYEEIGRIAAMRLMDDGFRSGQQTFTAKIVEHKSTRHEIEKSVLTT